MSINLSDLTSPNNQDVLAEITSGADLLDPIGKLKNLSRGANAGGHALQTTALNQPKALPLIKNPQGNLGGYLYIPELDGNYATGPSVTIGSNETWEGELDMVITQWGNYIMPMGGGDWTSGFGILFYSTGNTRMYSKSSFGHAEASSGVTLGTPFTAKYGYDGTNLYINIDGTRIWEYAPTAQGPQSTSITDTLQLSQQNNLSSKGNYAIQKAKLTVNSSVVFDCDFNGSTSIRHGDTKFQASVGGPVTLTKSGNDPATVIKKSVLRFANTGSTNIALKGLLNQTVTGGYMFAAFSVLGDGGEDGARVFGINSVGGADTDTSGAVFSIKGGSSNHLRSFFGGAYQTQHDLLFDDSLGDILHQQKILNGSQIGKVNNADAEVDSVSTVISAEEFSLGSSHSGSANPCIDLEFLAVFPASITDAQADSVRNYINNRNNVFSLIDSQGYYFYDAQKAPAVPITTGSSSWNGRIVGSDLGDSDRYLTQGTTNDAPVGDGFKVTFADNTDHLDIPQVTQAGWQVVGTSLGTFAYRVSNRATTELNLLGNLGNTVQRRAGDLYGVILLPESATGADIEAARKLLIDRGASDSANTTTFNNYWRDRQDIVEFKHIDTSSLTSFYRAWYNCYNQINFPLLDVTSVTNMQQAWINNHALQSFPAIQAPLCTNFTSAWQNTPALTSFPAGAKLGTDAENVNFSNAWRSSGLTSFPALNLSNGNIFSSAWRSCTALTSFQADAKLGNGATNVDCTNAWQLSGLTSFSTPLPTAGDTRFAWKECTSLTNFSSELPLATNVSQSWFGCSSLTDFSSDVFANWNPSSIISSVFNNTWDGCAALTAQSVENILTSIAASGKYATSTGASGGSALADAGIDIDYNVATGSLSAATNSAVTSLKSKGWSIFINSVEQ